MRNTFVETSNVKRFLGAVAALNQRGAAEACLLVVDGLPGLGKTTTLKHWVAQNGAIYLRAKQGWTPGWFMNELLENLNAIPPHTKEKKFSEIVKTLGFHGSTAIAERRTFGLVIDEADHISSRKEILETIRDITDATHVPAILVGMGKVNDNLKRFPQVGSRKNQKVTFEKATRDDVRALIEARCEVPVADCLAGFVLRMSNGFNREVLEAIACIERFGLRFDHGEGGVTLADMAGQAIMNNRETGRPVLVPELA